MQAKSFYPQTKPYLPIFFGIFCLFLWNENSFARSAKDIYQEHCHICHASGLAGAPKFQVQKDWLPRCRAKHLSGLVNSAMQGINAMPAKGTCETCQAKDIQAAIEYMVPKNEKSCH